MLNAQILDVAIGLVFIYFLLSLLCSVIIEAICGLTKKRPRMLKEGIAALINDPKALEKLYEQPLFIGNTAPKNIIEGLFHSVVPLLNYKKRFPSYISSRSFVLSILESLKQHPEVIKRTLTEVLPPPKSAKEIDAFREELKNLPKDKYQFIRSALVSILESAGTDPAKAFKDIETWYVEAKERSSDCQKLLDDLKDKIPRLDNVENIRELVGRLPADSTIRKALSPLLESAGGHLDQALDSMEKWYDEAMERVTGWYKRYSQFFAIVLAFFVALALNADTFAIGRAIYQDQSTRASLVALAGQVTVAARPAGTNATAAGSAKAPGSSVSGTSTGQNLTGNVPSTGAEDTKAAGQNATTAASNLDENIKTLKQYSQELSSLNLSLGWGAWRKEWKEGPVKNGIYDRKRDAVEYYWGFLCFWLAALLPALPGIAVTALLVSLGSSFWFELLGMLINVRNAGKKPLTRDEKEAASRRTGG